MHNVDTKRAIILLGICALLAGAITSGWNQLKQPPVKPYYVVTEKPSPGGEDKSAQESAAAQRAAFLARYLNSGFSRRPGVKMIAVAVVTENGQLNSVLNSFIADRFKANSASVLNSVFRPAFVADGLFTNALANSLDVIDKLELSRFLDVLLLGCQSVQYSSDPSLENVITANMRFELIAISIANGQNRSWAYNANGAGFKQGEARAMAEERLLRQIAKDKTLSLIF